MNNFRSWASGLLLAVLILLAPIIGFAVVVTAEMLTDLLAKARRARGLARRCCRAGVGSAA